MKFYLFFYIYSFYNIYIYIYIYNIYIFIFIIYIFIIYNIYIYIYICINRSLSDHMIVFIPSIDGTIPLNFNISFLGVSTFDCSGNRIRTVSCISVVGSRFPCEIVLSSNRAAAPIVWCAVNRKNALNREFGWKEKISILCDQHCSRYNENWLTRE